MELLKPAFDLLLEPSGEASEMFVERFGTQINGNQSAQGSAHAL